MNTKRIFTFWLLIVAGMLVNITYPLAQTKAIINYDFDASIDLREPANETLDLNKDFGLGDSFNYV